MSQHNYHCEGAAAPPSRNYSGHGTSSAFSSSANPDEDWTKISDLAERRRIQNRIAQRNYRKKLKMRLEDLERRAGTSDGPSSSEKKPAQPGRINKRQKQTPRAESQAASRTPPRAPQTQFTPPMQAEDYIYPAALGGERDRAPTPPLFAYSTYPATSEDMILAPFPASQPYRPATTEPYSDYLAPPVPVTLPPMTQFDALKSATGYPSDDTLASYMNYGSYLPGFDMSSGAPSPYEHSSPNTPHLVHSFENPADWSDTGSYEYPATPLSMPGSPDIVQQKV